MVALCSFVTILGFAGTLTFATTPAIVVLFFAPVVGGLALVEYARRHVEELDGIEISW